MYAKSNLARIGRLLGDLLEQFILTSGTVGG